MPLPQITENLPFVKCLQCGIEFKQRGKNQKYCSKECFRVHLIERREKFNEERRLLRQKVQELWGRLEKKGPQAGRASEVFAKEFLQENGFHDVKLLDYFYMCPFDIVAKKDGTYYVFQVTTRTHCEVTRHLALAQDLGLRFFAVFVKPDLSGALLRELTKGYYELTLEEVETLK